MAPIESRNAKEGQMFLVDIKTCVFTHSHKTDDDFHAYKDCAEAIKHMLEIEQRMHLE